MHAHKKQLLIFSWEYHGYHSVRGAALSRRVKQVAESFEKNGWNVIVIYKDHKNECGDKPYFIANESPGIKRITINCTDELNKWDNFFVLRKLRTLYYVALHGDRSSVWAANVIKYFPELNIDKPDLIISFFTPRAPLLLGNYFSQKLDVPWITDFQDPFDEGLSGRLVFWSKMWTRRILKSATARIHVSPEWAERDGKALNLTMSPIRHAVPKINILPSNNVLQDNTIPFKIFYGGSLNSETQRLIVLQEVLAAKQFMPKPVEILIAGTATVYKIFEEAFNGMAKVTHLGWLNNEDYINCILNCNCSIVIPWAAANKQVIPSKFYELCGLDKPIWIVGNDTGSFTFLLNEWQHPKIPFSDVAFQRKALISAMRNDYSLMFNPGNCKTNVIKEQDLFAEFMRYIV